MMLILLLTNCTSSQLENNTKPKIRPPNPYDDSGNVVFVYDEKTDCVIIPYWYWEKIFDYIVDTQAIQDLK